MMHTVTARNTVSTASDQLTLLYMGQNIVNILYYTATGSVSS